MKTNSHKTTKRIWLSAAIGCAMLLMTGGSQSANAQTNTFPPSGNAGIGTMSPTQALDVNGQVVTTGSQTLTVANKGVIEVTNTITNNASAVAAYRARNIFNGSGNIPEGLDVVPTFAPSANISLTYAGLIGGWFAPPSGVTITDALSGNFVNVYSNVFGAVTNGTTLQVDSPIIFGSLKPTTQYGLRIKNQGASSITTNYGLYVDSQSGATNNYAAIFAGGNVGIGTTGPGNLLHINNTSSVVAGLRVDAVTATVGNGGALVLNTPSGSNHIMFEANGIQKWVQYLNGSDFRFYQSGSGDKVTLQAGGNVGIGTNTPGSKLDVAGQIRSSTGGFMFPDGTLQVTASPGGTITGVTAGAGLTGGGASGTANLDIGQGTGVTVAADSISVNYGSTPGTAVQGNTSIGVTAGDGMSGGGPLTLGSGGTLTLTNADKGSSQNIFKNVANSTGTTQFSAGSNNDSVRFSGSGGTSVTFDAATKKVIIDGSTSTPSAANISAGQFGQNTGGGNYTFPGNVTVNGNIAAKYQDMAEWVPSSERLLTGTVVVLDSNKSNQVIASTQAYDTRVAGVVSEEPGIALGESGAGKVLVATTGRVLVQIDASKGPIQIGDLLVTSDVPGVAMKSEPVNIGGVQLHRPGTLIGKALEPLEKGSGKILVLLSLQ